VRLLGSLRGGTVVDVGANVGFIAIRAARRLGERGNVIAIEPHPVRFEFLQRNIRLNGLTNVRTVQCALGGEDGVATLYDVDPTLGPRPRDATMVNPTGGRSFQVAVRTLDGLLGEFGGRADVSLIKIDVEGYEAQVLNGMSQTLARRPPVVFEALNPTALEAAASMFPSDYTIVRLEGGNFLATSTA
jgi:FkbM family methyltransferase